MNTIEFFKEHIDKNANFFACTKDEEVASNYRKLLDKTAFLDAYYDEVYCGNPKRKVPFKTRLFHLFNNSYEHVACEQCGEPTSINFTKPTIEAPYNQYCSNTCRDTGRQVFSDYDWLYDQHITQCKPIDVIARENNVSRVPVSNALKRMGIERKDHRVNELLENYDWLYDQYINQYKTCETIASEIGSSKATVSVWLSKHGIDSRNPNSYGREFNKVSAEEQEVVDYIKSIYTGKVITSDRRLLGNGKEIDIYLPDVNLAIEYNGVWCHTEIYGKKDRKYHLDKTDRCEAEGVQLLHIWSCDWVSKKDIWKSIIAGKLGKNRRVYARKCEIVNIPAHEAAKFLDSNHLQGRTYNDTVVIGLCYDNEMVAMMTFAKSRFNKKVKWELVRFVNQKGVNVVGGASKLLKHFMKHHEGDIVSYADRTYSNGNLYDVLGFTKVAINKPNYMYTKDDVLFSRYRFQKKKLPKVLNEFNPILTERANVLHNGYDIVWNCGTITYIIKDTKKPG